MKSSVKVRRKTLRRKSRFRNRRHFVERRQCKLTVESLRSTCKRTRKGTRKVSGYDLVKNKKFKIIFLHKRQMQLDELLTKLKENLLLNVELFNKLEKEYKVSDIRLCEPIIDNSKYLVVLMTVIHNKLSENYHMQLNKMDYKKILKNIFLKVGFTLDLYKDNVCGKPIDRSSVPCIRTCGCNCGGIKDVKCNCFCIVCNYERRKRNCRMVKCVHCSYIVPNYTVCIGDPCSNCNIPNAQFYVVTKGKYYDCDSCDSDSDEEDEG